MTFGFASLVDLLSWTVAMLLALKVLATIVLLRREKRLWFAERWTTSLWWSTKITPLLAVLCMIAIAILQHDFSDAWAYAGLMMFVFAAVPLIIWRRFFRLSATER